jgi:SAM-dependent methyltransferase
MAASGLGLRRELARTLDAWSGDCPDARQALTRRALWLMFERLCANAGTAVPSAAAGGDIPRGFDTAVQRLLAGWEVGPDKEGRHGGDVLGYVFERSVARKAVGAYFTAPDVAAYICRSTLIPVLFQQVGEPLDLPGLAGQEGLARYLPPHLHEAGRLPLESPYEHRQRRLRGVEAAAAWQAGRIATVDDCLTWNLDLTRIALDQIEQADGHLARRWEAALRDLRVLDPTCGSGDFLLAAYDLLSLLGQASARRLDGHSYSALRSLFGVDLLPGAVEVTRMRLFLRAAAHGGGDPVARLVTADFLDEGPGAANPFGGSRFDAVIGNPPYVGCAEERERYRFLGYETTAGGNLYALVMERSLSTLAENGRLGMIVPISSVSGPEFHVLARRLTTGSSWVSTYSNRPGKLFAGVEQRLAIWLTAPAGAPAVYVSPYQHWWREERPYLFERLHYCKTAPPDHNSPLVKTGCPEAERILCRFQLQQGRLGDLVHPGEAAVWLHDGPTYWVRALPFQPNDGHAPKKGSHYHRLPVCDAAEARVLAAILSSTTFYLHYKWTSNCRDLGRRDWACFPFDPLPATLHDELAACGARLAETLRVTAARRTRVYPSGSVTYEEYYPARAKEILDQIDGILARHYGFTADELEYILNYDLKYRMGRDDAEHDEH